MVDRPTFVLLSGDLALAARLQTELRARLQAHLVWCGSAREVEEHLGADAPVAVLVEVPRRSARMLRALRELARRVPVVAISRPHDEDLAGRCLAVGALHAVPRLAGAEERLLPILEGLLQRGRRDVSRPA